jgi:hypothetical protein
LPDVKGIAFDYHLKDLVAIGFFAVPTGSFKVFFVPV